MTRILRGLAVLALLGALLPSEALAANVLVNPGFESGALAPWVNGPDFCGGCAWSVTNTESHTGTFSATVIGNRSIEQTFAGIDTGLVNEVSVWLQIPDGPIAVASIIVRYSDASFDESVVDVPTTWTKFDVTSLLDPGKTLVAFGVFGCDGCGASEDGATFADDFTVDTGAPAAVPVPATLALLLSTGAGLGAVRAWWRR